VLEAVLFTALLPAVAAGLLLLLGGHRRWAAALGVTAAFLIAWLFEMGWTWPGFPPPDSKAALGLPVAVAGAVALLPGRYGIRRALGLVPAFLVAYYVMSTRKSAGVAAAGAVAIVLWAWAAEALAKRRPGSAVPFAWMAGFGLMPAAFLLLHYAAGGQFLGALAAACGAWFVLASWRGANVAGASLPLAVAVYGVLANGYLFIYPDPLPLSAALLLGLAPLGAWIGEIGWFRGKPWWLDWGARTAAVVVIAATGVAIAAGAVTPSETDGEPDPYSDYYSD